MKWSDKFEKFPSISTHFLNQSLSERKVPGSPSGHFSGVLGSFTIRLPKKKSEKQPTTQTTRRRKKYSLVGSWWTKGRVN